jgi:hypothetical protein
MAKNFLYVCATLLCLTVAFQFGTRRAAAQAGVTIEGAGLAQHGGALIATGVVGRIFYGLPAGPVSQPIPGSAAVIATAVFDNSSYPCGALLANGDLYVYYVPGGWTLAGNLLGVSFYHFRGRLDYAA